jgi:hypothetical protein
VATWVVIPLNKDEMVSALKKMKRDWSALCEGSSKEIIKKSTV